MSIFKEIFTDTLDFFKTIGNRASNKHTSKGLVLVGVIMGADYGLDVETVIDVFDGASMSASEIVSTILMLSAYNYLIKKD